MIHPNPNAVLQLDNACISRNQKTVWSDSSLEIKENTTTAIIGMNGSGKTTLLEVMLDILHLDSGSITLFGKKPKQVRSLIGYVPQKYQSSATNALRGYDALALGLIGAKLGIRLNDNKIKERVKNLAVDLGIENLLEARLSEMSGGQLQKIAVGQALISDPKMLILDEPLASLDIHSTGEIIDMIKRLQKKDISIFIVTHDLNPIIDIIDGAIYMLDGHAHYLEAKNLDNEELLSHLYSTKIEIVHAENGAFIRSKK
jgi:zinc/manganese transport system ATP-binding protein